MKCSNCSTEYEKPGYIKKNTNENLCRKCAHKIMFKESKNKFKTMKYLFDIWRFNHTNEINKVVDFMIPATVILYIVYGFIHNIVNFDLYNLTAIVFLSLLLKDELGG